MGEAGGNGEQCCLILTVAVESICQILGFTFNISSDFTTSLLDRYYYPHFTDKRTEAQRSNLFKVTRLVVALGCEPTVPAQCSRVGGSPLHAAQCLDSPSPRPPPPPPVYTSGPFPPTFTADPLLPPRALSHNRPAHGHRVGGHLALRTTSAPRKLCVPPK